MKRLVVSLLFVAGALLGCAQNYFNIPAESFAEKVKVLGVAPIFLDADSDIIYPQKDHLLALISDINRKNEPLLVRKLQDTGNFYAVTQLADNSQQLFNSLMARREKRNDAAIEYNKYFWKTGEITSYINKNRLDALMVVIVSGLTQNSKIYSSNLMTSLETDFNFLTMTAQIIGPDGTVLWEYPNFRGHLLSYNPMINLQYPDFSESEANKSHKTEVRFKSIDGIRRSLEQKKVDYLFRETQEPAIYGKLFDDMISLIKHSADRQTKSKPAENSKQQPPVDGTLKPATVNTPAPATELKAPQDARPPESAVKTSASPAPFTNEIVPATKSTL